jgi:hypothetical protein
VFHAEVRQQLHILGITVVVVAGRVAIGTILDGSAGPAKSVPDAGLSPVQGHRPFDLIRRGGGAPPEISGKTKSAGVRQTGWICGIRLAAHVLLARNAAKEPARVKDNRTHS